MKTRIEMRPRKRILRIRVPKQTYEQLQSLSERLSMDLPEMGRFLLSAAARCNPARFHKAVAEMIEEGERR